MMDDLLSAHKKDFKDYTELRAQVNASVRVTLLSGSMTANTRSSTGGVCARVYKNGVYGFASGAEYSEGSIRGVVKAATDNALFMDARSKKGLPPLPSVAGGAVPLTNAPAREMRQSEIIDFAKALDAYIEGKYKNLASRTVIANTLDIEKLLCVSDGTDAHTFQPRSIIYVAMAANTDDGAPVELIEPFGGLGLFCDVFTDPALLHPKIDELYQHVMRKREGVYASAGLRKCVMHPALAGMLAHEAVGHTVEADLVEAGSVAGPNLNKRVASELITMIDFAHTALGKPCPLPVTVDDEGTPAQDAPLIEKGVLTGYMHSKETAQRFGHMPRGNARAFLFSDEPLVRMRNTAILPGDSTLEDMFAGIDDGYYLVKTGNGQADTTGEFMFSVDLGYEIKGGKLGRAIRDTTISGVAFDMLKTVDMLSGDMVWTCSGFCGKKQPMTVGMGGPAIRCELNIGGR